MSVARRPRPLTDVTVGVAGRGAPAPPGPTDTTAGAGTPTAPRGQDCSLGLRARRPVADVLGAVRAAGTSRSVRPG